VISRHDEGGESSIGGAVFERLQFHARRPQEAAAHAQQHQAEDETDESLEASMSIRVFGIGGRAGASSCPAHHGVGGEVGQRVHGVGHQAESVG